jgi:dUTP pyrophosphatase
LIIELCGGERPVKAHETDAGFDLYTPTSFILYPFRPQLIKLGFKMQLPKGTFAMIVPRSGLALDGISVVNSPGIIDENYRNEVGIILILLDPSIQRYRFRKDDRIGQMIILPNNYDSITIGEVDEEDRGGGFGSTGV